MAVAPAGEDGAVIAALLLAAGTVVLDDIAMRRTRSYTAIARLNAMWHSVLPESPAGMRVGFVFYAGAVPIACAMWGRPSARMEDQTTTMELTRLAHSPSVPRNFGSWALARMRAWIREHMPEIVRIISYQDASIHHGTIYRADNWRQVYDHETTHSWGNRPGRLSNERQHKIKWEREP